MSKTMNRRAMLSGATILPMLAIPAFAKAMPTEADTELFDIIRQWKAGKALEISFGAEHTAMERLARANELPVPPELMQPIELPSGSESPGHARGWTKEELERFASFAAVPNFTRSETGVGFDLHFIEKPVPVAVRARARELLAIKNRYDAAYNAVWNEAEEGQKRFDQIVSDNTDLIMEMAETPAHTLQGLLAKCHVCKAEHLFEWHSSFNDVALSLVEDIERIAPQFIGRA